MEYLDLICMNGEIIRVEYKTKYMDEFLEAIDNAKKRNDTLGFSMFEGTTATYMGLRIERIYMADVVGWL